MLIGLDYDGTLAPIANDPASAELAPNARMALQSLARRQGMSVAIISGRGLEDLFSHIGVDGLVYAGNHGIDISGLGLRFVQPGAIKEVAALSKLSTTLTKRLQRFSGLVIENKEFTLTVHVRRVARSDVPDVARIVGDSLSGFTQRLHMTHGKEVFEIRPSLNWNKGSAILWICEQMGIEGSDVIYFGDDVTDEDAFNALPIATTIKVGDPENTAARHYVDGPEDVLRFLCWFNLIHQSNR